MFIVIIDCSVPHTFDGGGFAGGGGGCDGNGGSVGGSGDVVGLFVAIVAPSMTVIVIVVVVIVAECWAFILRVVIFITLFNNW